MILDTSAIVAVLLHEPEAEQLGSTIGSASTCRIGSPTLVEATLVLMNKQPENGKLLLAGFLQHRDFDIQSFGDAHWRSAQSAFHRYGKGRHPAALNFGDCLTYATAAIAGEPLLCLGDDFPQTDLELVPLD